MSWYSKIYISVRNYREQHPVRGWLATRALNTLLILQYIGFICSVYVYIFCIGLHVLKESIIQAQMYISIYLTLGLLAVWSLTATIFTPVARVPPGYAPSSEKVDQLKAITPFVNGRYLPEKSDDQQFLAQMKILTEMTEELRVEQAESDEAGRSKFCYQCNHLKPDRTHHCMSCGNCVVRFDHHCPWINHCVNHNNYKFFLLYVFYSTITVVWFLLGTIESVIRICIRQEIGEDWPCLVQILAIAIPFGVFGYYPLGELLIYHFGLISINETTCEQAKPTNIKNDFQGDYNMGRAENFAQVFGWGLWTFPVNTTTEDGMHFKIRYVQPSTDIRYERTEDPEEESAMTKVLQQSKSKSKSNKIKSGKVEQ